MFFIEIKSKVFVFLPETVFAAAAALGMAVEILFIFLNQKIATHSPTRLFLVGNAQKKSVHSNGMNGLVGIRICKALFA